MGEMFSYSKYCWFSPELDNWWHARVTSLTMSPAMSLVISRAPKMTTCYLNSLVHGNNKGLNTLVTCCSLFDTSYSETRSSMSHNLCLSVTSFGQKFFLALNLHLSCYKISLSCSLSALAQLSLRGISQDSDILTNFRQTKSQILWLVYVTVHMLFRDNVFTFDNIA